MVRRFSPFALGVVALLFCSGLFSAFRFVCDAGALLTSAYGLTLLLKLILVGFVLYGRLPEFSNCAACAFTTGDQSPGRRLRRNR